MHYDESDVTQLLKEWGDSDSDDKLMPLVFDDILDIARRAFVRSTLIRTKQTVRPADHIDCDFLRSLLEEEGA